MSRKLKSSVERGGEIMKHYSNGTCATMHPSIHWRLDTQLGIPGTGELHRH